MKFYNLHNYRPTLERDLEMIQIQGSIVIKSLYHTLLPNVMMNSLKLFCGLMLINPFLSCIFRDFSFKPAQDDHSGGRKRRCKYLKREEQLNGSNYV
jgi:hypothetical protein